MTERFSIAPDGARVIALNKPISDAGAPINTVRFKQPKYRDFMEFGDPTTLIVVSGAMLPQDDLLVIKAYAERLCDIDPLLLEQISLTDAMVIRDAIKSFFLAGSPSI